MTMTTSAAGRVALMQREGCKLRAYRDTVGVLTIGTGHTGRASPPLVTAGMAITQAQADAMFEIDLAPFEAAVNKAITRVMTQNQFDACTSLAFNIGAGGFATSTVVRKFNDGDIRGAADAFLLWTIPAVLKPRRQAERAQFLMPDRQSASTIAPPGAVSTAANKPSPLYRLWSIFARQPAA
jgi:lysozyme